MRFARRSSVSTRWRARVLPLCAALALGCHGEVGDTGTGSAITPTCDPGDPAQVVEQQRIMLLTSTQLINMVKLVSPEEAQAVIDMAVFEVMTEFKSRFPPAKFETRKSIPNSTELVAFDLLARHVGAYVRDHFMAVTQCATPGTDACATAWLEKLAARVYRRPLSQGEKDRLTGPTGLYYTLKSQIVNGCQVTTSVEDATGNCVYGLFMTPQVLWRWELGGGTPSTAPPGIYLTDAELASQLSFFLTDEPPDEMLIAAAAAGNLRANMATHVDRILATPTSRTWLAKVMRIYFTLNQLPGVNIDPVVAPIVQSGAVFGDMEEEAKRFTNEILWNGKVMDLITSRKTFVNYNLATMIYNVPAPAGTSATDGLAFGETTLPADQRSGLLTNAGFITRTARTQGVGVVPRGLAVKALFLCLETPAPPDTLREPGGPIDTQVKMLDMMTAREQVDSRAMTSPCSACHPSFDPYGLVLDWYDVVGRFRTVDHLNKPIDGTTSLPPDVGGQTVHSAVELADVLSKSTVFMNCMAKTLLQYGLTDTTVELPIAPPSIQRGCAAAGVANKVQKSSTQSFSDMVRAVAASPAFVLRKQVQ